MSISPADDDPLRRLTHVDQLEALRRMFGDPEPSPAPGSPAAAPARGSAGATITFRIHWKRVTRGQLRKMSDADYAAYDAERTDAEAYVGDHPRQFERPFEQWTAEDLQRLCADMLATLRKCPIRQWRVETRESISVHRFNARAAYRGRKPNDDFHVTIRNGSEYRAEVSLLEVPIPARAIVEWLAAMNPSSLDVDPEKGGLALRIHEYLTLGEGWTRSHTPDPDPAPTPTDEHDDDSDGHDDLEEAERPRVVIPDDLSSQLTEMQRLMLRLSPDLRKALLGVAAGCAPRED
jgi:hypothetical protein